MVANLRALAHDELPVEPWIPRVMFVLGDLLFLSMGSARVGVGFLDEFLFSHA